MKDKDDICNGTITNQQNLQTIISTSFPSTESIEYAFGYGSGVFIQEDENKINTNENSMIDLIFSVSDPKAWHEENIKINPHHYAALPKLFGTNFISMVQNMGAGCYFNPMVQIDVDNVIQEEEIKISHLVKYGVISHTRLKQDLMDWESIYVAGRMQKPILPLQMKNESDTLDDEIYHLQEEYNLKYALSTALLLLPQQQSHYNSMKKKIKINHIFESIAGLSYIGDPRVVAGAEDPGKVSKLVNSNGQLDRFLSMYEYQISKLEQEGVIGIGGSRMDQKQQYEQGLFIEMDLNDAATRRKLYQNLPKNLQHFIQQSPSSSSLMMAPKNNSSPGSLNDAEIISFANYLTTVLSKIVGPPSRIQSGKGLLTAGLSKSIRYVGAKLAKGALRNFKSK